MNRRFRLVAMAFSLAAAIEVQAAIVWDYSPDATGAGITEDYMGPFFNRGDLQYFAETVRFQHSVRLSGMDIYEPVDVEGAAPTAVTIRIWRDQDGSPGTDLDEFQVAISAVDADGAATLPGYQRVNAGFVTPIELAANTDYWIGMSGYDGSMGQLTLNANAPGDSRVFVFDTRNQLALLTGPHVGDMAFRLHGEAVVPLPGGAPLLASALVALLANRRRHHKTTVAQRVA